MKKLVITALFLLNFASYGDDEVNVPVKNLFCSTYYASLYLDSVLNIPYDKAQHCALSCQVALKCNLLSVSILGISKEVYDIIGPGNAEWGDLTANFQGIILSRYVSTRTQCIERCKIIYIRPDGLLHLN